MSLGSIYLRDVINWHSRNMREAINRLQMWLSSAPGSRQGGITHRLHTLRKFLLFKLWKRDRKEPTWAKPTSAIARPIRGTIRAGSDPIIEATDEDFFLVLRVFNKRNIRTHDVNVPTWEQITLSQVHTLCGEIQRCVFDLGNDEEFNIENNHGPKAIIARNVVLTEDESIGQYYCRLKGYTDRGLETVIEESLDFAGIKSFALMTIEYMHLLHLRLEWGIRDNRTCAHPPLCQYEALPMPYANLLIKQRSDTNAYLALDLTSLTSPPPSPPDLSRSIMGQHLQKQNPVEVAHRAKWLTYTFITSTMIMLIMIMNRHRDAIARHLHAIDGATNLQRMTLAITGMCVLFMLSVAAAKAVRRGPTHRGKTRECLHAILTTTEFPGILRIKTTNYDYERRVIECGNWGESWVQYMQRMIQSNTRLGPKLIAAGLMNHVDNVATVIRKRQEEARQNPTKKMSLKLCDAVKLIDAQADMERLFSAEGEEVDSQRFYARVNLNNFPTSDAGGLDSTDKAVQQAESDNLSTEFVNHAAEAMRQLAGGPATPSPPSSPPGEKLDQIHVALAQVDSMGAILSKRIFSFNCRHEQEALQLLEGMMESAPLEGIMPVITNAEGAHIDHEGVALPKPPQGVFIHVERESQESGLKRQATYRCSSLHQAVLSLHIIADSADQMEAWEAMCNQPSSELEKAKATMLENGAVINIKVTELRPGHFPVVSINKNYSPKNMHGAVVAALGMTSVAERFSEQAVPAPPTRTSAFLVTHLSLEGTIGAGKSTAIAHLSTKYSHDPTIVVIPEPTHLWGNLLGLFYQKQISPLVFQMTVLTTLHSLLSQAFNTPGVRLVITERSPRSGREVFAQINLDPEEMRIFDLSYETLQQSLPSRQEVTVMLDTDIDVAMQRIATRGRVEEQGISREYLMSLEEHHNQMYAKLNHPRCKINVSTSPPSLVTDAVHNVIVDMLAPPTQSSSHVIPGHSSQDLRADRWSNTGFKGVMEVPTPPNQNEPSSAQGPAVRALVDDNRNRLSATSRDAVPIGDTAATHGPDILRGLQDDRHVSMLLLLSGDDSFQAMARRIAHDDTTNVDDLASALARVSGLYIDGRADLNENDLRRQFDAMQVAHADVARASGTLFTEDILTVLFDNALPESYSNIRRLVQLSDHATFADHFAEVLSLLKGENDARAAAQAHTSGDHNV